METIIEKLTNQTIELKSYDFKFKITNCKKWNPKENVCRYYFNIITADSYRGVDKFYILESGNESKFENYFTVNNIKFGYMSYYVNSMQKISRIKNDFVEQIAQILNI
jgi:hypothetical protein